MIPGPVNSKKCDVRASNRDVLSKLPYSRDEFRAVTNLLRLLLMLDAGRRMDLPLQKQYVLRKCHHRDPRNTVEMVSAPNTSSRPEQPSKRGVASSWRIASGD
ncbi:hypothetical protein SERLA73DRAFT_177608 [Serpula lacrymans var. lacrymans S7.3]|uniref:Uncharacterized protein n=2 Tax=Serpula lacrymans var. lacrymans TaxID=341189 RepID=F8PP71_SERL3|nr:uncharacterized protein SERLADRAFT_446810 [Serpula lacrymans var. lacrymans S7.9]EGO01948.1 hypothetical protein SERLA73DRAFT_177608 [Serpula lacrymans var. lacrymans S7.3]EGO27575.1 hypothetical protein SERLADRAFT_446810 [Serpula lacrymans var. lacrymans S7.9]